MKSFLKQISLFGIILLAAALICVVSACQNDSSPEKKPEIPSALQNTTWTGSNGSGLTIHENSATYRPVSGSPNTYTLYESETSNGTLYLRFSSQGHVLIVSCRNNRVVNVFYNSDWSGGTWEKINTSGNTITYTVFQTEGVDGLTDTYGLNFFFSASVDSLNLTAADITVGGVASKGTAALTGSGASRGLGPITVNAAGTATVKITKTGIESGTKNVTVYKAGQTASEYWSITWYLNDGAEGTGEYPTLIEKGETLAKPSPDPTKGGYTFGGWYTDYDLTQAYNFADPVTTNLTLYAKWGQPPVEPPGPNSTLAEKLAWVLNENNVADGQTYTFEVSADEAISYPNNSLYYTNRNNITIILKSSGGEKIISLAEKGPLLDIGSGVTLVLDRNITLKGLSDNYDPLVIVGGELIMNAGAKITDNLGGSSYRNFQGGGVCVNGTFTMNGGEISGNSVFHPGGTGYSDEGSYGAGVYVNGTFTMNGGKITDNKVTLAYRTHSFGVGVFVSKYGTFTMNGGEISNNSSYFGYNAGQSHSYGGGVCVEGTFIMKGGEISDNTLYSTSEPNIFSYGGGVCLQQFGTFTMSGGKISGNTASGGSGFNSGGGGVYVSGTSFTMTGGTISGNTVSTPFSQGGGVYVARGTFTKTGGTIYGYDASDTTNSNVVKNSSGSVVSDQGHAVYVRGVILDYTDNKRRETTAGPTVNLDSTKDGTAGGWEE